METIEIQKRYQRRNSIPGYLYHPLNPSVYMSQQEKERALIRLISYANLFPIHDKKVLEIGCGSGTNLLQLIRLGFNPDNLTGNELLEKRVLEARHNLPAGCRIIAGDASQLTLADNSFDIVIQSTVFSSLLDNDFQNNLANKMWSLVKPGGGVVWYDFIYNNPKNPDVRGVPLNRVRELFPDGSMKKWRLTLAPPINRFATRLHPSLYTVINSFPFLRTHILCWIKK